MSAVPSISENDFAIAREREILARHLLRAQSCIPELIAQRKWRELYCLAEFVEQDVDPELIATDPALYRTLRNQVTELNLAGFGRLNRAALEELIGQLP